MSLVHRCDRCRRVSDLGDVDDLPDGWRWIRVLVKGSNGAPTGVREVAICKPCDDQLYAWFYDTVLEVDP